MQKEFESAQMRPLAKAVTKTLEKVRGLIREQVIIWDSHTKFVRALIPYPRIFNMLKLFPNCPIP